MHGIRPLIFLVAITAMAFAVVDPAQAGRRGAFAHHTQVKVWHGNRVTVWSRNSHWSGGVVRVSGPGWHGAVWAPGWRSGWAWSRSQGYPTRWWAWNSRKNFAARRHARQAFRHAEHGWNGGGWHPKQQGVWHASPGFGSNAPRRGPEQQGVWYSD